MYGLTSFYWKFKFESEVAMNADAMSTKYYWRTIKIALNIKMCVHKKNEWVTLLRD